MHRLRAVGEVHAPACMAQTASRVRRCSRGWCGEREPARRRRKTWPRAAKTIFRRSIRGSTEQAVDPALIAQDWLTIQHTAWNYIGLARTEKRLQRAQKILTELQTEVEDFYRKAEMSDALVGLRNGLIAALTMLSAAIEARVSVGCHFRSDDQTSKQRTTGRSRGPR